MSGVGERAALVPVWVRALAFGAPVLLCAYWGLTYSGLYRLLAELQLSLFGAYMMVLTGAFTLLVCILPGAMIVQLLGAYYEANADIGSLPQQHRSLDLSAQLNNAPRRIVALIAGAALALFGVYQLVVGALAGEELTIPLATLARGDDPPSSWVRVEGAYLRMDEAISFDDDRRERIFVPVDTGSPRAALFVELSTYERDGNTIELFSGTLPGMLYEDGLPGLVREEFARRGALADRYWLLDYRDSPASHFGMGSIFIAVGLAMMLMTALVWVIMRRRGHP